MQCVSSMCVMVPIRTENRLHFSVRLDNGALEVRVERMACEGAARELRGLAGYDAGRRGRTAAPHNGSQNP